MPKLRVRDRWRWLRVTLAVMAIAAVAALATLPSAAALECQGIALDDGCLFTITGGDTSEPDDGYAVTNADGVPLWDFVRERDLQAIGYPISQRWVNGPFTFQAFQKGDPPVGPRQEPHELLQHARRAGEPLPRVELPNVPAAPGAGSGPGRRLRHHHPEPPGAAGPEPGDQGAVPQRARLAEPLRPADPLRGAGGQRPPAGPADAARPAHGVRHLERAGAGDHRGAGEPAERTRQGEETQQRDHSRRGQGAGAGKPGDGVAGVHPAHAGPSSCAPRRPRTGTC